MRAIVLAALLLGVGAGDQQAVRQAAAGEKGSRQIATMPSEAALERGIRRFRAKTWHWQRVFGQRPTRTNRSAERSQSLEYKLWALRVWKRRASRLWLRAKDPPHEGAWLCIHRFEGHWRATPGGPGVLNSGGPYYGGLQMDLSFQQAHGGYLLRTKGTADRWTPLEQMWVAERAHRTRGFTPWPNTARMCGLL